MVWFGVALAVYLAILVVITWVSLHPPRIPVFISPGAMGAPQEEVEFESQDGTKLRGWWVEAENATAVAVLSHGYVMNRSELAPVAHMLWEQGVSCLLYDFRAHGRSGGRVTTMGHLESHDVAAAARYAKRRCQGKPLVLIGSSMGSAASAFAWANDAAIADAMVLDSCYSTLASASLGWWRFLGGNLLPIILSPTVLLAIPAIGLNPFRIDVSEAMRKLSTKPVLFLHGNKDVLALPKEAIRNHGAWGGSSCVVWFDGCGHSEGRWILPELYRESLFNFLEAEGMISKSPEPVKL